MKEMVNVFETLQADNMVQVRFVTKDNQFISSFLTENPLEMYMFLQYLKANVDTICGLEKGYNIDSNNYTTYDVEDVMFLFDKTVGEDACRPTIRVIVS